MTKFNQNIPSLKSTLINARKIDAKEINLNGKNIESLKGLNLPQDYPKLVSRVNIPEGALFELYDDWGNMVYTNCSDRIVDGTGRYENNNIVSFEQPLINLEIGDLMFKGCLNLKIFKSDMPKLKSAASMFNMSKMTKSGDYDWLGYMESFEGDTSSLENGFRMFAGSRLKSFKGSLKKLNEGGGMFVGCDLDYNSFVHIINEIKNNEATKDFGIDIPDVPSSLYSELDGPGTFGDDHGYIINKMGFKCTLYNCHYI